jgi:diphthine synthase
MVLYVIGLGLWDEKDITVRGLEAVRGSVRVYLEAYTSILMSDGYQERLEELYGKSIILAHREVVELQAEDILSNAAVDDVSFLVVGDPLSATTHSDLILRARQSNPPIPVKIIHNASIMTAIASSGLQPYNFGQTISVPFWTESWRPDSWLPRIAENNAIGNHTLVLGDIKVREQSQEDMARGVERYQAPRFMLIPQLITQLLSASQHHQGLDINHAVLSPDKTLAVALCRMGTDSELILSGTLGELLALASPSLEEAKFEEEQDDEDEMASEQELEAKRALRSQERAVKAFGPPLHSLVIVGHRLHHLEMEYAGLYAVPGSRWKEVAREAYGCTD